MALVQCLECGREISSTARSCPQCGAKRPRNKTWIWVTLGTVTFLFFIAVISGPKTYQDVAQQETERCIRNSADGAWTPSLGVSLETLCETHGAKIALQEACAANAANCR